MHKGVADPLEVVAAEISDEAIILCLDEFMVCKPSGILLVCTKQVYSLFPVLCFIGCLLSGAYLIGY